MNASLPTGFDRFLAGVKAMRPLMVDAYRAHRITGSFILIDEVTNQTVAGGMILGETGNV